MKIIFKDNKKNLSKEKINCANKERILGFDVCNIKKDVLINNIFEDFNNGERIFIVNINPEIVAENYKNEDIKKVFNEQKYQIPDGIGIVMASKLKKGNIKERITGIDLMDSLCKESQKYDCRIFLYGAKPNIAEKAKLELEKKYPKINIVGVSDGYGNKADAINKIKETSANIVFVALGSPRQENFIMENIENLKDVKIFMPVGGSLDVISNTIKRAPKWMQKANIEWLYRLIKEPKRIFRQLNLPKFLLLVIFKKVQ